MQGARGSLALSVSPPALPALPLHAHAQHTLRMPARWFGWVGLAGWPCFMFDVVALDSSSARYISIPHRVYTYTVQGVGEERKKERGRRTPWTWTELTKPTTWASWALMIVIDARTVIVFSLSFLLQGGNEGNEVRPRA